MQDYWFSHKSKAQIVMFSSISMVAILDSANFSLFGMYISCFFRNMLIFVCFGSNLMRVRVFCHVRVLKDGIFDIGILI